MEAETKQKTVRQKRALYAIAGVLSVLLVFSLVFIVIPLLLRQSELSRLFVKEKLKITTVKKIDGESIENIDIIPCRPVNMVDILVEGYAFRYEIESDLVTYKDYGIESDYLRGVEFDRWLKVHLRKPIFETEVPLGIEVWDYETLESIISFGGWNDLTLNMEWQQPDQSLPSNAVIWKRMNVTVIEEGAVVYQEIFPWKPTDMVSVYFVASGERQTLDYKVETDLETLEGVGEVSGFRTGAIRFHNRITVNVTPTPMGQADVRLTIHVDDRKYMGKIAEYSGWNDLTMILEWM